MTPKAAILGGAGLMLAGAASATYLLTQSEGAARLFGLNPQESSETTPEKTPIPAISPQEANETQADVVSARTPSATIDPAASGADLSSVEADLDTMEARLARIEQRIGAAEGSAGRADALLIAFAARRAIDRGLPLGYLEPLLVDRFGDAQERSVAQVVTASRNPVMLEELVREYEELGPVLRQGSEDPGLWDRVKRELSSIAVVYRADRPNPRPRARYERALVELRLGNVDAALAETMRLPGARQADGWVEAARRYIATRNSLDRLESAALLARDDRAPPARNAPSAGNP